MQKKHKMHVSFKDWIIFNIEYEIQSWITSVIQKSTLMGQTTITIKTWIWSRRDVSRRWEFRWATVDGWKETWSEGQPFQSQKNRNQLFFVSSSPVLRALANITGGSYRPLCNSQLRLCASVKINECWNRFERVFWSITLLAMKFILKWKCKLLFFNFCTS